MKEYRYYIYIATNKTNKVLYTGVTNSLLRREFQHKTKYNKNSFTAKYNVSKVVYYEIFGDIYLAIGREKEVKGWTRQKKINLIRSLNPKWEDLLINSY